jgi:hypothetical protein
MKNLFFILLTTLLIFSCTSDTETDVLEEQNSVFSIINNEGGKELLLDLQNIALENATNDKYVEFTLDVNNGSFIIEKSRELTPSRNIDALLSYYKKNGSFTLSGFNTTTQNRDFISSDYLIVCCDTGNGDPTCVTCDGNQAQQATCAISEINDCVNSGGCSVVCGAERSTILYNPKEGTFTIYKK